MVSKNRSANPGVVLITGGSSGIGFELARCFASHGHDLVIVSKPRAELERACDRLRREYDVEVIAIQRDLAEHDAPWEIRRHLVDSGVIIDYLVNNAGFATYGFFHEIDLRTEHEMIQVNVAAVMVMTKLFLRDMLARDRGRILNVSSTAGIPPLPSMACYAATKGFIYSLGRALSHELRGITRNVTVTTLCPAPTRSTGFARAAGMDGSKVFNVIETQAPADVARVGYEGMMRGRDVIYAPWWYGAIVQVCSRLLPTRLMMRIVKARVD
jgi:uncharacterized protein